MSDNLEKPFRVLSLDGGGMRGLYTASILNSLASRYADNGRQLDIGSGFDIIVGTSTGGILATALAFGVSISEVVRFYKEKGPLIFTDPTPDGGFSLAKWAISNASESANENLELEKTLEEFFGEMTIGGLWEARGIGLCLTAVDLSTHNARVFKTPHFKNKNADNERRLVDVCLASSAAPIILPISRMPDPDDSSRSEAFIDGGLWANNPILVALVEAMENSDKDQPIEIVSIGTCPPRTGKLIPSDVKSKGLGYWKVGIEPLTASMDAQASGYFHTAKFLAKNISKLGKNCVIQRLHESVPSEEQAKHLGLDKVHPEAIETLGDLAAQDARTINGKINNEEENYAVLNSIFEKISDL